MNKYDIKVLYIHKWFGVWILLNLGIWLSILYFNIEIKAEPLVIALISMAGLVEYMINDFEINWKRGIKQ